MKYPRTFHLPWSPGGTDDDKRMKSVSGLIGKPIVITEKLDGSNSCLSREGIFARSHSGPPAHKSFDLLKSKYYEIKHLLKEGEQIFGENCFAVHSIEYEKMSDFFFVFGILNNGKWLSWVDTEKRVRELGLKLAPLLFEGQASTVKELESLTNRLAMQKSSFGGDREGLVIRVSESFLNDNFSSSIGKWVRKDHIQSDEHWKNQEIKKQNF